jgi:hypothetical protein
MRKIRKSPRLADDLRAEYKFDYSQGRPNRFASRMRGDVVAVVLDPDVAEVFDTSALVNRVLRSVISAKANRGRRAALRKPRRKAG